MAEKVQFADADAHDQLHDHGHDPDNDQQVSTSSDERGGGIGSCPSSSPASVTLSLDGATGENYQLPKPEHPPLSKLTQGRIMSGINGSNYTALKPFDIPKNGFTIFKDDSFDLVLAIDYNAHGTRLVTASADRRIRVYDLNEESELSLTDTWSAHDAIILAVSHDYREIYVQN